MKKVGKVVLWAVAVLVVIEIVGAVVVRSSRRIRPHTVLTLRIEGDVPEQPPLDPLAQLGGEPKTTVTDIVEALDRARSDSRITGVRVLAGFSTMSMAKLQEVREKLREFNPRESSAWHTWSLPRMALTTWLPPARP